MISSTIDLILSSLKKNPTNFGPYVETKKNLIFFLPPSDRSDPAQDNTKKLQEQQKSEQTFSWRVFLLGLFGRVHAP